MLDKHAMHCYNVVTDGERESNPSEEDKANREECKPDTRPRMKNTLESPPENH